MAKKTKLSPIRPGTVLMWIEHSNCIKLINKGKSVHWYRNENHSGDNKRYFPIVQTSGDFTDLPVFLGELHKLKPVRYDDYLPNYEAYKFTDNNVRGFAE